MELSVDTDAASAAYIASNLGRASSPSVQYPTSPSTRDEFDHALQKRYSEHLRNVLPEFRTNKKDSEGESPVEAIANDKPAQEMLAMLLSQLSPQTETDIPIAKEQLRSKHNRQSSIKLEKKMSGIDLIDVVASRVPSTQLFGMVMDEPGEMTVSASDNATSKPIGIPEAKGSFRQNSTNDNPANLKEEGVLGDYLLQKTIGEGCFSKVKMAIHFPTNQKVAIKCMDKKAMNGEVGTAERTLREILVLSHLFHPNITRLLEVVDTPDFIYLILEYEEGGELFDYIIAHKIVPELRARIMFRQLLSALQYCHVNGIVHRDLKPENILLDAQGNMKLIDFGFSNVVREENQMDTYCGSPSYAAPEMIGRKKYNGQHVDIWALGVVLFVLICGYHPFDHQNVRKMYSSIITGKYTFPESFKISEGAKSIISLMLRVKPSDRATLEQLQNHLWTTDNGLLPPVEFHQVQLESPTVNVRGDPCHLNDIFLIKELERMGFSKQEIDWAKTTGDPGPVMAAYHLLRAEKRRKTASAIKPLDAPLSIRTDVVLGTVSGPIKDVVPRTPLNQVIGGGSPSKSPIKSIITNEAPSYVVTSPASTSTSMSPQSATSPSKRVSSDIPGSLISKIRTSSTRSARVNMDDSVSPSSPTKSSAVLHNLNIIKAKSQLEALFQEKSIEWTCQLLDTLGAKCEYKCQWAKPSAMYESAKSPEEAIDLIMQGMLFEETPLSFSLHVSSDSPSASIVELSPSANLSDKESFYVSQLLSKIEGK
ncbi:kinase-like domain-containing protein [Chytriomyces sp. MP71]|nr:kinase-like domain-containing protein [Chytriomyces sp. MP71]